MIDRRRLLFAGIVLALSLASEPSADETTATRPATRRPIFTDDFESASMRAWSEVVSAHQHVWITMSTETVNTLASSGFALFGFRAVRGSDQAARPLVWIRETSYGVTTVVELPEISEAYTSHDPIAVNERINPGFIQALDLGQILVVDQPTGTGVVKAGGSPGAISIRNDTTSRFTTGLAVSRGGTAELICAFPLFGGFLDVITPIDKVLLMFSTLPLATATVVETMASIDASARPGSRFATSPGILIDFTGVEERSVTFDLDSGWSSAPWSQLVSPSASLVPLLIEPDLPTAGTRERGITPFHQTEENP